MIMIMMIINDLKTSMGLGSRPPGTSPRPSGAGAK